MRLRWIIQNLNYVLSFSAHLMVCVNEFTATPHSSSATYGLTTAVTPAGTLRFQHAHLALARGDTYACAHVFSVHRFFPCPPSFCVLGNKISFEANAVSELFEHVPVHSYLRLFLI